MHEPGDRDGEQSTLHTLMSELETLLASLGDAGSRRYREGVVDLRRKMRRARDQVDDLQYATSRRARRVARQADHYVRENPWASAAAAAALGAAVGALVALVAMRSWQGSRGSRDGLD